MDEHFIPNLLVSDEGGNVFDVPELRMTGMSGTRPVLPETDELIDLPYGSDVFMLPDRIAVGFDPREEAFVLLPEYQGKRVFPVAAFMAPAYMQFLLPAYREPELPEYDARSQARTRSGPAPPAFSGRYAPLPMYGYTAVGWRENGAVVPAVRIDDDIRQDLACVDLDAISEKAPEVKKHYPGNRLVAHLVDNCALCYGCPAARNFVLGRWECPVPASRVCNAGCIGCISYQQKDSGMRVAQERIAFVPTADEIVEFTVPHLESADKAVISFGQGCEGEPLMVADLLIEAVAKIRERTSKGIINLNTNGSKPDKIPALAEAGLDSIRVSINSVRPDLYTRYYNPSGYGYKDVVKSVRIASEAGMWTSLNYFIFPGITDELPEVAALKELIRDTGLRMIQTRTMNIDPMLYLHRLGCPLDDGEDGGPGNDRMGMSGWLKEIRGSFPELKLGYFNPSRETMNP